MYFPYTLLLGTSFMYPINFAKLRLVDKVPTSVFVYDLGPTKFWRSKYYKNLDQKLGPSSNTLSET